MCLVFSGSWYLPSVGWFGELVAVANQKVNGMKLNELNAASKRWAIFIPFYIIFILLLLTHPHTHKQQCVVIP